MERQRQTLAPGPGWVLASGAALPAEEEVLVVLAPLDVPLARLEELRATFSEREEARYRSFAHAEHRRRWGASRGFLRTVLGAALGRRPSEIGFRLGPHGKPELEPPLQPSGASLRFNLSHSGGAALLGLARGREVGSDLELPRPRRTDDLARRFFAPGEQKRLFAVADEVARRDAFFRLWTCKEAFLKGTGEGLGRSLRSYEIENGPAGARLLWAEGIPDASERWSIYPLEPGGPWRAAVVVEGQGLRVRSVLWPLADRERSSRPRP